MVDIMESLRELIRAEVKAALSSVHVSDWVSQQEAAKHCGVNVATIRNWHKQGLKAQRAGRVTRYSRADLDAFMRRHTASPVSSRVAELLARKV